MSRKTSWHIFLARSVAGGRCGGSEWCGWPRPQSPRGSKV